MEDDNITRSSRRRAGRACCACHRRKVRCDMVPEGIPCTNCRRDGDVCEPRRRQQKQRRNNVLSAHSKPNQGANAPPRSQEHDTEGERHRWPLLEVCVSGCMTGRLVDLFYLIASDDRRSPTGQWQNEPVQLEAFCYGFRCRSSMRGRRAIDE